jgi:hypothetical protein
VTTNLRVIVENEADDATLTASPALVSTLPVTNLQEPSRALVARTTSLATQDINGALSSARIISACAMTRHNLTSVGTWRLRLYSDAAWATLVYDSGNVVAAPGKALGDIEWGVDALGASMFDGWEHTFSTMWFAPVAAQSFKITLSDAANPDGYIQASRLYVGRYLEPMINFEWEYSLTWAEATTLERTAGGTLRSDGQEPYRRIAIQLNDLTDSDRPKFADWARKRGLRGDVFVSLFPQNGTQLERDHSMAAKLVASPEIKGRAVDLHGGEFILEEL